MENNALSVPDIVRGIGDLLTRSHLGRALTAGRETRRVSDPLRDTTPGAAAGIAGVGAMWVT